MPELLRRNHKLTVGFIHVGGDFGEKLYWCHARRRRQLQLAENRLADFWAMRVAEPWQWTLSVTSR